MSYASLLNQTITLYNKSSYDSYGREQFGSGSSVQARVEVANKVKLLPNGETVVVEAVAFLQTTATISVDDKVSYNGVNYKVLTKEQVVDADNVHHYELELVKWR